jgi:arylsulfatase A-like enzyme
LSSSPELRAADVPAKPNIVVVLFDDLGWCEPTTYWAQSEFKMPNLDRLAREGMRFTDAHSAAAVCTPTRYGLLTGRYPWRIGQYGVLTTFSPPIIPRDRLTLPSLLRQNGYHTAAIGKWHLGMNWEGGQPGTQKSVPVGSRLTLGPNAIGFDYFCGFTHARNISTIIEKDQVIANVTAEENQPIMIKKAIDYIEARATSNQPFFLYFPMGTPHEPVVPSPDYLGKSGANDKVRGNPRYGDWIYQGDAMLGLILDALDRHGIAENTLIVATSDNGAEHRAYPPLRESKRSVYEGGHRVPFAVRWPGKVKPGAVNDEVVCLNDLMATVADIIDAKLPANAAEDSVSLLATLLGTATGPAREATVHQSSTGDLAIRQGPWKLVLLKTGKKELYNLQEDRAETKDLSTVNPEIVARMTKLMQAYIDKGRSTSGAAQRNDVKVDLPQPGANRRVRE